jgi:DNA replication protein DnaC
LCGINFFPYQNFVKLHLAKADGSYAKELARLERMNLLILDDWDYNHLITMLNAIMQLIEDRHGKTSTVITLTTHQQNGMII